MSLIKLKMNDLSVTRNYLKRFLPFSQPTYNMIDASIKTKIWTYNFYTLEGSTSMAILTNIFSSDLQSLNIFWDAEEHDDEEVRQVLTQVPSLDWKKPVCIAVVNDSVSSKLHNILSSSDLLGQFKLTTSFKLKVSVYSGDISEDRKTRIPQGYEISSLSLEDIRIALAKWEFGFLEKTDRLSEHLNKIPNYCALRQKTQTVPGGETGKTYPSSFCALWPIGLLNLTYTEPEIRLTGVGLAISFKIIDSTLDLDIVPLRVDKLDNAESLSFLQTLNFKAITDGFFGIYHPC